MSIEFVNISEVKTVGERIYTCRKSRGLSRRQLAELLSVSVSSITHYERNESLPSVETLCKLAVIFNMSVNMLMFGCSPSREPLIVSDGACGEDDFIKGVERIIGENDSYKAAIRAKRFQEKLDEICKAKGCMKID